MTVTKNNNGAIVITDVINSLVTMQYMGYRQSEAVRRYKNQLKINTDGKKRTN